jgi:hypothetical protein
MSMAAEIMTTKPGPTRDTLVSWPRGSGGWGRAGHLGWRVLAVSVLVIMLVFPWGPVATADDVAPPAGPTAQEAAAARDAVRAGELDVAQQRDPFQLVEPIGVVHHDGVGRALAEGQVLVEHPADAGLVARDVRVGCADRPEQQLQLLRVAARLLGRPQVRLGDDLHQRGAGSVEVAIIMTIGAFINLVICIKFVPLIVNRIPPFRFDTSYHLLKYSLPYFMWSIFAVIYYRIDAVMLSTMTSEEVVGWYGGAYRFFDIIMFLPAIFTTVVFPIFSKLWGDKGNNLVNTFQQSLKFILLAAIPICVLFFYYSAHLVSLFYGLEEYEPSIIVLQIFSIGIILIYVDFILGSAILATDRQRLWAFVGLVAILINIGLNFLLIPYTQESMGNGGVGAAITTLFTELFIMIAAFIMLPNSYFKNFKLSIPLKCIGSGVIMFATIWYLNSLGIFWMLQATAGFGVYALMVISLRVINKNELQFMREFFTWQNINSIISIKKKEQ